MSHPNHVRALLICPGRDLAKQFTATTARRKFFEVFTDITAYPAFPALETSVRQHGPEAILIDVATDLAAASALIQQVTAAFPSIPVVGLHTSSDANAILTTLRAGATEFLYAPFDPATQDAALTRMRKLIDPHGNIERARGKVIAFTSAKPGSGATTLTLQAARALRKSERRRVVVIDLNLGGGSAAFCLGLTPPSSIENLLAADTRLDHGSWSNAISSVDGIDVLPAPELPYAGSVDPGTIAHILDHARGLYEWVLLDLPCAFDRLSLACVSEADRTFVISGSDLASLHLTRRAVKIMRQFGFDASRFGVLLNRMDQRSELTAAELKKLLDCDVDRTFPIDKSQETALTAGTAVDSGAFSKAVEALASKLIATLTDVTAMNMTEDRLARPVLSKA